MSIDARPPQPPRLSPDGKWVWDGSKWQPIVAMPWEGADATVVSDAAVAKYAPPPVAQRAVAVTPHYSPPVAVAPASNRVYPVVEEAVKPWEQAPRSGKSPYLYFAAGLVALVMAGVVLNTLGITQLPWFGSGTSNSGATPTPSLPPPTVRSDYGHADRFLNLILAPALAGLDQTVPPLNASCNGTLSNGCLDAITATDKQVKKVLALIDRGEIPSCIAAGMAKFRGDLAAMDGGLQLAIKAYADNLTNELAQGLYRFGYAGQALATDAKSVDRAQKTQCSTQVTGP